MEIWKFLVLFFCAFLGGLAIFLVKNDKSQLLKLILSFSGPTYLQLRFYISFQMPIVAATRVKLGFLFLLDFSYRYF
jgi:zinc and cadmium transporter